MSVMGRIDAVVALMTQIPRPSGDEAGLSSRLHAYCYDQIRGTDSVLMEERSAVKSDRSRLIGGFDVQAERAEGSRPRPRIRSTTVGRLEFKGRPARFTAA